MKKIIVIALFLFFGLAVTGFSQTVYASESGKKYHTADCKLSGNSQEMTIEEAKKEQKQACNMCKPDKPCKTSVQCEGKTLDQNKPCKRMTCSKSHRCFQHTLE